MSIRELPPWTVSNQRDLPFARKPYGHTYKMYDGLSDEIVYHQEHGKVPDYYPYGNGYSQYDQYRNGRPNDYYGTAVPYKPNEYGRIFEDQPYQHGETIRYLPHRYGVAVPYKPQGYGRKTQYQANGYDETIRYLPHQYGVSVPYVPRDRVKTFENLRSDQDRIVPYRSTIAPIEPRHHDTVVPYQPRDRVRIFPYDRDRLVPFDTDNGGRIIQYQPRDYGRPRYHYANDGQRPVLVETQPRLPRYITTERARFFKTNRDDAMGLSFLSCICCWIIGVFAIAKSMKSKEWYERGDSYRAKRDCKQAKMIAIAGITVGSILAVIGIIIVALVVADVI